MLVRNRNVSKLMSEIGAQLNNTYLQFSVFGKRVYNNAKYDVQANSRYEDKEWYLIDGQVSKIGKFGQQRMSVELLKMTVREIMTIVH